MPLMRLFLVLLICILATSTAEHDTADEEDTGCGCGSSALTREAVFTSSSQKEQCINDDASLDSPALAGDVIRKDERNGAMDALDGDNDDDPFTEALIKDELAVVGKMKLKAIKEELRRRDVYNVDGPPMFSSGKKASKRELVLVLSKLRAAAAIERQGHQGSSGPSSGSSSGIRLEGGAQQAWFTETMVHVPGGAFVMGTNAPPPYPGDGEGPSRLVVVSDFLIDQAEVTNSQFAEFVASSGYETESERFGWSFVFDLALTSQAKHEIDTAVQGAEWWLPVQGADWRRPEGPHGLHVFFVKGGGGGPEEDEEEGRGVLGNGGGGDGAGWRDFKEQRGWRGEHPAVHVSWADSVSYCAWRNGSRLPTEAEWEYAAQHKGPPGRDGRKSARHASPSPPPSTLKDFAASVLTPPPALPLPTTLQGTSDGGSALALETASSSSSSSSSSASSLSSTLHGKAVEEWDEQLKQEVGTWVGVLVRHESSQVLEQSGLAPLLQTVEVMRRHGPLATQPGCDAQSVEKVMRLFYASLFALVMPSFERLEPVEERNACRRLIAAAIADAHAQVHALVVDPLNSYVDQSFLVHTPDQVRMLLDCD